MPLDKGQERRGGEQADRVSRKEKFKNYSKIQAGHEEPVPGGHQGGWRQGHVQGPANKDCLWRFAQHF